MFDHTDSVFEGRPDLNEVTSVLKHELAKFDSAIEVVKIINDPVGKVTSLTLKLTSPKSLIYFATILPIPSVWGSKKPLSGCLII